ncbi:MULTISPECIES: hypothetical protein [unclassified Streptomyces]|uniref:hypothetical protein n=1 Tax=unclassified Streptomyces TaxID=2593676 RepID=UPI0033EB91DE
MHTRDTAHASLSSPAAMIWSASIAASSHGTIATSAPSCSTRGRRRPQSVR